MNCDTCHSLLTDFVYDELDEGTRAEVEAALENCPECRAELAMLRRTAEAFDTIEALEVPAKLHNDILRAARLAAAEARPQRSRWAAFFASPALSAALSILLLAGGGAAFYQLTYGGGESASESPYIEQATVAAVSEADEAEPETIEEEEMELAEELAPTPAPPEEALVAPAAEAVEHSAPRQEEEERHSLDQIARNAEPVDREADDGVAFDLDNEGRDGSARGEPTATTPVGGSVTGASSSGRGIADFDASAVQRGGGGRTPHDDSRIGNMAPSAPRSTGPSPPAANAQEPEEPRRQRSNTRAADSNDSLAARDGSREHDSFGGLRPDDSDPHAPGSAATINEARGDASEPVAAMDPAPEAELAPEPEPTVAVAAPSPMPPAADSSTYAMETQQGYGQAGGGAYDDAQAHLEAGSLADREEFEEEYAPAYAEAGDEYEEQPAAEQVYLAEAERSESSNSNSASSDYDTGIGHYDNGRYGRATRALGRFLDDAPSSDPRRAEARYFLGAALYRQGDYRLAQTELRQFLSENPGHAYASDAEVLLEDIEERNHPTNRRYAPSEALDSMEAQ